MIEALRNTPKPILLLIISFLFPSELSLYLDGLRLPPHRVVLLPIILFAVYRIMIRSDIRIRSWDVMFVLFGVWTTYVYYQHTGDVDGFIFGASQALDSVGAYIVTRAYIRTPEQCRATLKAMVGAIGVAGLIALPETLLGELYTHNLMRELTGIVQPTGIDKRMGLTRAYGTFDHPIHYGTFCAGLFAFLWAAERRHAVRGKRAAIVAGATFLGLSSAPLLSLMMQSAMLIWERFTRGIAMRTAMTVAIVVGMYLGASLISNRSPITLIATGMTFDSWTGFYRIQIWTHGMENVWGSPWTGIGQAEWERPGWMVSSTIDAFWLVLTMRTGIPSFFILVTAISLLGRAVVVRGCQARDGALRRISNGWMMSLIALCLVGTTVHYWNVLYAYFFFFLGMAGWIADPTAWSSRQVASSPGQLKRRRHPSLEPGRPPVAVHEPAVPLYLPAPAH
jgi:hypothetical protein